MEAANTSSLVSVRGYQVTAVIQTYILSSVYYLITLEVGFHAEMSQCILTQSASELQPVCVHTSIQNHPYLQLKNELHYSSFKQRVLSQLKNGHCGRAQ